MMHVEIYNFRRWLISHELQVTKETHAQKTHLLDQLPITF